MASLRNLVNKYNGYLRSLKATYVINNVLNYKKLKHNKALYDKYGIQKSIFNSFGSKDIKNKSQQKPWIDLPDASAQLRQHPDFSSFSPEIQEQIINFIDNGFMVLKGFYNPDQVQTLNKEVDGLLNANAADFNYTGKKIMDAFQQSKVIDEDYFRNPELLKLLNFVMGAKVVPFQTINFIQGSEQKAHSDSIHMTTEPEGYLVAVWAALEPTHENNGPLFYYPKSHRLPYVTCQDYFSGNTKWQIGDNSYKNYEEKIAAILEENTFKKEYFYAETGDVFVWHANLLHGGSPIKKEGSTRKSMVAHYFCEDVICYHEITQRPAMRKG